MAVIETRAASPPSVRVAVPSVRATEPLRIVTVRPSVRATIEKSAETEPRVPSGSTPLPLSEVSPSARSRTMVPAPVSRLIGVLSRSVSSL